MENIPDWYVVTGGPSSGKTTILNELAKLGFKVFPEAARTLIDRELAKGRKLEEIRADVNSEKEIGKIQIEMEKSAPKDRPVFFEGGIPDRIVYLRMKGIAFDNLSRYIKKPRYKKIFFCQQLPFVKDHARIENEQTALELSQNRRKIYEDLGYKIIDLPPTTPKDRLEIILREIKEV